MTLGRTLASKLAEATLLKTGDLGLRNAELNAPFIKKTIHDLLPDRRGVPAPESAMVVCAGPSLHHRKSIDVLKTSGYADPCVVADGGMSHCLKAGLIPQYVVTLDPHPDRIIRWFGDPDLAKRAPDDYFRRQDLDPDFARNEVKKNQDVIEAVNRHAPSIKLIIATCIDPGLTRRAAEAGFDMYWWNPLYDDTDAPGSVSRKLFEMNGVPCMVTGGNVGSACWVFSQAILGAKNVGLVGMDLGYRPGTPLSATQYYYPMKELLGDRLAEGFIPMKNPYTGEDFFTDPTYFWYRDCFLSMSKDAPGKTWNCTEGGTLFGEGVEWSSLADFTARFGKKR